MKHYPNLENPKSDLTRFTNYEMMELINNVYPKTSVTPDAIFMSPISKVWHTTSGVGTVSLGEYISAPTSLFYGELEFIYTDSSNRIEVMSGHEFANYLDFDFEGVSGFHPVRIKRLLTQCIRVTNSEGDISNANAIKFSGIKINF
jgi:hypothetical protein